MSVMHRWNEPDSFIAAFSSREQLQVGERCRRHSLDLSRTPQFPEGVIFEQDGAPPHYGNIVREFLDTTFPQRWIGRGAVMAWPPRSPDITPLDFYL
ncbi:hypothetical protein AVEN_198696-1 [Araneus ventricosus]|uniref:Tc1-like transposase DDE domain-containing protein n=1 Tax=Araneus ventricosus TaxID=182803 RepID=A0A4Y2GPP0_ARAVE|nr:hypothetical protein AVEN_165638-1 [Araneus ventricosus]GBM55696.1 hypothetical protein AVEN_198696-1 [Araneus ventricosus]